MLVNKTLNQQKIVVIISVVIRFLVVELLPHCRTGTESFFLVFLSGSLMCEWCGQCGAVDGAFEMVGLTATASFVSYELLWAQKRFDSELSFSILLPPNYLKWNLECIYSVDVECGPSFNILMHTNLSLCKSIAREVSMLILRSTLVSIFWANVNSLWPQERAFGWDVEDHRPSQALQIPSEAEDCEGRLLNILRRLDWSNSILCTALDTELSAYLL